MLVLYLIFKISKKRNETYIIFLCLIIVWNKKMFFISIFVIKKVYKISITCHAILKKIII